MIRTSSLAAALLVVAFWSGFGNALESSFPDLERIIDAGKLVVALPRIENPPYVIEGQGQELQGFDVWLARQLAAALEVDLQLDRTGASSAELIDLVAAGKADLALGGILVSALQAMKVRFSRPYIREAPSWLLNRRSTLFFQSTCPTLEEMRKLIEEPNKVALQKGSRVEETARRMAPKGVPRLFDDPLKQFDAVLAGDILVSIHTEAQARYLLHKKPSARIKIHLCLGGARSYLVAIAVRPDAPDLLRWVNTFLEARLIDMTAEELLKFGEQEKLWP
jgi:polar amino acid transport system substrate-binding protein